MKRLAAIAILTGSLAFGSGACQHSRRPPPSQVNYQKLKKYVSLPTTRLGKKPIGPVKISRRINYQVALGPNDSVLTDIFLPQTKEKAPLAILVHGNHSRKEAHRYQAVSLATWGINAVVVQLINESQWLDNAKLVQKLATLIHRWPAVIGDQVDPGKIVLIGHSFGGSAVSLAAANGAPVAGLVLLDPAVVHDDVLEGLPEVKVPVALLGADPKVFRSRKRDAFFHKVTGEKLSVSIVGATHDDLQHPSMYSIYAYATDPFTDTGKQVYAQSLIVLSVYSMTAGNGLHYAVANLKRDLSKGRVKDLRHRPAPLSQFAH